MKCLYYLSLFVNVLLLPAKHLPKCYIKTELISFPIRKGLTSYANQDPFAIDKNLFSNDLGEKRQFTGMY